MKALITLCFVISWTVICGTVLAQIEVENEKDKNQADLEELIKLLEKEEFLRSNIKGIDTHLGDVADAEEEKETECVDPSVCDSDTTEKCVPVGKDKYYCKCKENYKPESGEETDNTKACIKKNKCDDPTTICDNDTTEKCVPVGEDKYYCKCKENYKPESGEENENTKACIKKNKCDDPTTICDTGTTEKCVPVGEDKYYCKCKENYKPESGEENKNTKACIKKNKCDDPKVVCDAASTEKCVPVGEDKYYCKCKDNYKPESGKETDNIKACIAMNICEKKEHKCSEKSTTCVVAENGFYCECLPGYVLPKGIDKKEDNKEKCVSSYACKPEDCKGKDTYTQCVPKGDDYYCGCRVGYKLVDEKKKETKEAVCVKMNKCDDGSAKCDAASTDCKPIDYTDYYCNCKSGYKVKSGEVMKNKQACTKKTICEEQTEICPKDSTKCVPKGEGYYCDCLPNYYLPKDVKKDENKEECESGCDSIKCLHGGKCLPKMNKSYKCECTTFYTGQLCENVTCDPNPCQNGGECKADKTKNEAECQCKGDYTGDTCEIHPWCAGNTICKPEIDAKKAECVFDKSIGAGYCKCNNESLRFDYKDKKCKEKPFCWKDTCTDKTKWCNPENGKCECRFGYKPDDKDNTKCVFKLCEEDPCFSGSDCSQRTYSTIKCSCNETKYYTSGNVCKASSCLITSLRNDANNPCQDPCPGSMKRINGQCKPTEFKEDKDVPITCNMNCGKYGYCNKVDDKELCECITEAQQNKNGTCVLKKEVCPDGVELVEDQLKCNCTGKFKMSSNGITCDRKTCEDEDAQKECGKINAICNDNWKSGEGYDCQCPDGYFKDGNRGGICLDKCSILSNIAKCSKEGKICFLNEKGEDSCMCPPGLKETFCTDDIEPKTTYIVNNLAVSSEKYVNVNGIDVVALTKDVIEAMNVTFQNLQFARLFKYSLQEKIVNCAVWLQFLQPAEFDYKRVQLQAFKDTGLLLPGLMLKKEKITNVKEDKLYLCSGSDNDPFCGATKCEGGKCSCPSQGYRIVASSVKTYGGKTIFSCEDKDECSDGTHNCYTENSKCVNTQGSYYCRCLPQYKLKEGVSETENQQACIGICNAPNPCNNGECKLNKNNMADCSCKEGYSGSFCDRRDVVLQGAVKKTVVVGAVLGSILGVLVIAFVVYIIWQRKNSYSEDFTPPMRIDNAEMSERRPMRGVQNRAYQ